MCWFLCMYFLNSVVCVLVYCLVDVVLNESLVLFSLQLALFSSQKKSFPPNPHLFFEPLPLTVQIVFIHAFGSISTDTWSVVHVELTMWSISYD